MNSENIKKVYVVNLNKGRVIILSGAFTLLMGLTFLAGVKWVRSTSFDHTNPMQFSGHSGSDNSPDINPVVTLERQKSVADLPEEDNRIFEQNSREKEDPFLSGPHEQTISGQKKNSVVNSTKTDKKITRKEKSDLIEKPAKRNEKYFCAQIGAFVHEKDANALKVKLAEKKIDARVEKGALYYFVRTGKSKNKESLDSIIEKIHDKVNIQAIVVQNKVS